MSDRARLQDTAFIRDSGQIVAQETPMDIDQIRDLIPVTRRFAYLNHACVAAPPRPVTEAMTRYLQSCSEGGSEATNGWDQHEERIRQLTASFIEADTDEITFTGSVSQGLNIVAAGIGWKSGDNLICAETEFPANVYPWTNLRRRGVEVRFAKARANRISLEDVAALMDGRTRLVAISFVEFGTGYRNDLEALAALCHERKVYLCVDGIQGLGALQFSVKQTPVDFLATHAAKWMLGPIGAGFLFVRRDLLSLLEPVMSGWRSVVDRDNYFCYDSPLRSTGERFEPGSLNNVGLLGMEAAMDLLLNVGLDKIESRVLGLTDSLIEGLQGSKCVVTSPVANRRERSGIVCFRHPKQASEVLAERLQAAGVVVAQRGDVIRVSPHFYNTQEELERLLDTVPA